VLEKIGPGSLLIVQGDRQDIIHTTISANETQRRLNREPGMLERLRNRPRFGRIPDDPEYQLLAGIVFTNGRRPAERDIAALRQAGIFALLVQDEIYPIASQIHGLLVKTHAQDRTKIEVIKKVIAQHFDVDGLLERLERLDQPAPASSHLPHVGTDAGGGGAGQRRSWAQRRLQRLTEQASRLAGPRRDRADRG
jgi:hypothetical protein